VAETVANGLRFHVEVLQRAPGPGEGRPKVVMVHGLSVDMSSFYLTIVGGVAVESDVYLYDLRGHGRSEVPERSYSVADHLADLVGLLDAWEIHEPVHLFGNSFGGIVALFFAHHHPERVASLFLIEPHLSGEGWGRRLAEGIVGFGKDEADRQRVIGNSPSRIRWAQRAETLLRTTSVLEDLLGEAHLPRESLEALRCPVFSIYGSGSDVVEEAGARDRHIPGCRQLIVPGCTHRVLAEASLVVRDHAIEWVRGQSNALTSCT
jgi:pimeloyl-ACP methyl ester carboxylesterase